MSAFIVEIATIDRVVEHMLQEQRHPGWSLDTLQEERTTYGRKLFAMNRDAVIARYGDRDDGYADVPDEYEFRNRFADQIQTLKSMQCVLYQCAEARILDQPLFLELDRAAGRLAQEILRHDSRYESAHWG